MAKIFSVLLFAGLLAACSTPPTPKYAFGGRAPIEEEAANANAWAELEAGMKREGYDSRPQPISTERPVLTQSEINAAANGIVRVRFLIDVDGKVSNVELLHACTPEVGEIVRAKVLQWRFKPAMKGGKPVAVHAVQDFEFRID